MTLDRIHMSFILIVVALLAGVGCVADGSGAVGTDEQGLRGAAGQRWHGDRGKDSDDDGGVSGHGDRDRDVDEDSDGGSDECRGGWRGSRNRDRSGGNSGLRDSDGRYGRH